MVRTFVNTFKRNPNLQLDFKNIVDRLLSEKLPNILILIFADKRDKAISKLSITNTVRKKYNS